MSTLALRNIAARGLSGLRENAATLAMFAAALFVSALLLFSVQPIFAKMILPKLGGAPSVWAVSMVFFQAILLAGYAYAHALNRWCPKRHAPLAHLGLMAAAALALPFGLPAFADEPPAGDAYLWLIGVLTVGVGLPFFAVSANAPLLQSWFARSGHPQAADPYFLYGASNLGSLIALLGYPILVEPTLRLSGQASVWTSGFLVLGVLIALCGLLVVQATDTPEGKARTQDQAVPLAALSRSRRAAWLWLSAIPSGLLVSFTSYVTTDVASAPFLWVIPLALFLATFILVFRETPLIPHHWMVWSLPVFTVMTLLGVTSIGSGGWVLGASAGFAAFFVTTMVCHRELYELRPDSRHLTAFYMWMSCGGVVGGIFAALIAPQIFNAIYEYPLLLLAGLASRKGIWRAWNDVAERRVALIFVGIAAAVVVVLALIAASNVTAVAVSSRIAPVFMLAAGTYLLIAHSLVLRRIATAAIMALALFLMPSAINQGFAERSFFGVHRVMMYDEGQLRLLMHGTTLHGAMRVKDATGTAVETPPPATYYYPGSPMARGVEVARGSVGKADGGFVVASVGVGAGSMSCYARANEDWTFYDIDPLVVRLATNPKLFTFLSRCRPDAKFVIGDARLTLGKVPAATVDYLVIDAFASDSIPVHLLTREAIELYLSRLSPQGLLVLHISNQHMDLADVASTIARSIPDVSAVLVVDRPVTKSLDALPSTVMFLAKSPEVLADIKTWNGATPVAALGDGAASRTPWTDDYSNVLGAILKYKGIIN